MDDLRFLRHWILPTVLHYSPDNVRPNSVRITVQRSPQAARTHCWKIRTPGARGLGGCNVLLCGPIQQLCEWQSAVLQQLEEPALYIDGPVSATAVSSRNRRAFNAPC